MKLLVPSLLAFLTPVPSTLASLQSLPFKVYSLYTNPSNPALDNRYLRSLNYHMEPFFYAILAAPSSGTPLIGYLNGTDSDARDNLSLEFQNVSGYEGADFGFSFDTSGPNAPYTPVELVSGTGIKGMYVSQGNLQYSGQSGARFFGKTLESTSFEIDN